MTLGDDGGASIRAEGSERRRLWREATTMMLYLAIVLLVEFVALPAGRSADGTWHGASRSELLAVVWGTTIGLVLAHAFAFQIATHGLSGGHLRNEDRMEILVELAGAAFVAAVASVPVIVVGETLEQRTVPIVLSVLIGTVGYVVERANGHGRTTSAVFGAIVLVAALCVAALKYFLTSH